MAAETSMKRWRSLRCSARQASTTTETPGYAAPLTQAAPDDRRSARVASSAVDAGRASHLLAASVQALALDVGIGFAPRRALPRAPAPPLTCRNRIARSSRRVSRYRTGADVRPAQVMLERCVFAQPHLGVSPRAGAAGSALLSRGRVPGRPHRAAATRRPP